MTIAFGRRSCAGCSGPRGARSRAPSALGNVVAVLGGIAGFYIAGYTGILLAVTNRPIWSDTPLLGMLFVVSAASTSAALLILLAQRAGSQPPGLADLQRFDVWMIVLELLVLAAVVVSLGPVLEAWLNAWGVLLVIGVVILGLIVPLVAVVPRRTCRRRKPDDFVDPGARRRLAVAHRRGVVLGVRVAMRISLGLVLAASIALAGCESPEATRTRGGGPGADGGNRPAIVKMHEGSRQYLGNACDNSRRVGIVAACQPRAADQPAMTPTATALAGLRSQRPEWAPWLAVVEETLRDGRNRAWDAAVPTATRAPGSSTPLLAGATVALEANAVRALLRRLIDVASRSATPQMVTLQSVRHTDSDLLSLFKASALSRQRGGGGHCQSVRCGRRRSRSGDRADRCAIPPGLQPPVGAFGVAGLARRILRRVRRVAGICGSAWHRANPRLPVRPLRGRVACPSAALHVLRHGRSQRARLARAASRRIERGG